jgi:hypothetical protein
LCAYTVLNSPMQSYEKWHRKWHLKWHRTFGGDHG